MFTICLILLHCGVSFVFSSVLSASPLVPLRGLILSIHGGPRSHFTTSVFRFPPVVVVDDDDDDVVVVVVLLVLFFFFSASPLVPLRGLILSIHGGPHSHFTTSLSRASVLFSILGFAVLHVNYRGSTGTSLEELGVR